MSLPTLDFSADRAVIVERPTAIPHPNNGAHSLARYVAGLLADAALPAKTETTLDDLEEILHHVLEAAFIRRDEAALLDVHQTLFSIYELSFANPLAPATAHANSPWVLTIRNEAERAWLASDFTVIGSALPDSGDRLPEKVLTQWFVEQSKCQRPLDLKLITYLADEATLQDFKIFLLADAPLNYRFYDAIALAQLHFSETVKQELSRHFWDECGEGDVSRCHTVQFTRTLQMFNLQIPSVPVWNDWRPYAGYNMYLCLALNRRHYFKAIGSLAMPELFDPDRDRAVVAGLSRVTGRPIHDFTYYYSHIAGDEDHGPAWLEHVVLPIIRQEPNAATELMIGAAMRMEYMRRFNDYLAEAFGLLESSP